MIEGAAQQLVARSVRYFSRLDETMFFAWLDKIDCVASYEGRGLDLHIYLRGQVDDESLRELTALFHRYHVNLSQFAAFQTEQNQAWFTDPRSYWYAEVFGRA